MKSKVVSTPEPLWVVAPGFDVHATIRTAIEFNAIIIVGESAASVLEEKIVMPVKFVPHKIEDVEIELYQSGKPWSKKERYKRKF